MQFNARQDKQKDKATEFEWAIVHGNGGRLLNARSPWVTFIAPSKINEDSRNFTLELRTRYASGLKPSKAQINIRVHRKTEKIVKRKTSPWLHGTIGFGFGYMWGGWWPYPPVIVIPCPPPGVIIPPEELLPIPVPLPEDPDYGEWLAEHPAWEDLYGFDTAPPDDLELPGLDELASPMPANDDLIPLEDIEGGDASLPELDPLPEIAPAPMIEPVIDDAPMDRGGWGDGGWDDGGMMDDGMMDGGGWDGF